MEYTLTLTLVLIGSSMKHCVSASPHSSRREASSARALRKLAQGVLPVRYKTSDFVFTILRVTIAQPPPKRQFPSRPAPPSEVLLKQFRDALKAGDNAEEQEPKPVNLEAETPSEISSSTFRVAFTILRATIEKTAGKRPSHYPAQPAEYSYGLRSRAKDPSP